MTLEEAIRKLRKEAEDWRKMSRLYPDNCDEFIRRASDNDRIADYLEELKELREKYKNVSEACMKCNLELFGELEIMRGELEVYKKALEISCEWNELNLGYLNVDECLQKAREEMDEEKLIGGNNYGR